MDQGEGQHWNLAPGNLYSKPQKMHDWPGGAPIAISLDRGDSADCAAKIRSMCAYRIQSALLTKFWGRPMFLSAVVLVPEGFDEHPKAHYPEMVFEDHFVDGFDDFRTTPPDANLKPDYSERFHLAGYNRIQQEEATRRISSGSVPKFPRYLVIKIQHANPYYDDSYAVNSANLGPYGDAIETELMPAIEKQFRGIGQGWARFSMAGRRADGSRWRCRSSIRTHYNGAFVACPDPVDFHAYTTIDLYDDKNAFYLYGAQQAGGAAGDARLPGPHADHDEADQCV
jgi:hypothetical protein